MKLHNLRISYRQILFLLLLTPNAILNPDSSGESSESDIALDWSGTTLWIRLREYWSPTQPRTPSAKARLFRIQLASVECKVEWVEEAIKGIDELRAVQRNMGAAIRVAGAKLVDARPSKSLIRDAIPWASSDPSLQLGKNGAFFGFDTLHPTDLNNCIAVGGTGTGKSRSLVIPLLSSLLHYQLRDKTAASVLVVDPKKELHTYVRDILKQRGELSRLVVIGEVGPIQLFSSDIALSMSDKFFKLLAFCPVEDSSEHSYWRNLGQSVLLDILRLEASFAHQTYGLRMIALMCNKLQLQGTAGASFWEQLRAVLAYSRLSRAQLKETDELLRTLCTQAEVVDRADQVMRVYTGDEELIRQWAYAVQSVDPVINALASPDLTRYVDTDPLQSDTLSHTDVGALVECGKVILFCPEPTEGQRLAAMALKAKFFEAVFSRENQRRPIGIVVDEAQKFVSCDPESGEQSFLDRCRAYRCIAVLATQSLSSLKYALGSDPRAQHAVDILIANTPTKFIFRTTDSDTVAWLKTQLPNPADGSAHVVDIRRPASLRPGEAYFLLSNGTWGRRRAALPPVSAQITDPSVFGSEA